MYCEIIHWSMFGMELRTVLLHLIESCFKDDVDRVVRVNEYSFYSIISDESLDH